MKRKASGRRGPTASRKEQGVQPTEACFDFSRTEDPWNEEGDPTPGGPGLVGPARRQLIQHFMAASGQQERRSGRELFGHLRSVCAGRWRYLFIQCVVTGEEHQSLQELDRTLQQLVEWLLSLKADTDIEPWAVVAGKGVEVRAILTNDPRAAHPGTSFSTLHGSEVKVERDKVELTVLTDRGAEVGSQIASILRSVIPETASPKERREAVRAFVLGMCSTVPEGFQDTFGEEATKDVRDTPEPAPSLPSRELVLPTLEEARDFFARFNGLPGLPVEELQHFLRRLEGASFDEAASTELVRLINEALQRADRRVACPTDNMPSLLRCQVQGDKVYVVFDHFMKRKRTQHGGSSAFPALRLVDALPDRRKKPRHSS